MPVRNAAPYLDESIESILGQSFSNFEFVIRDDGSTDGSRDMIRAWAGRDSRIRAFEGPQLGLTAGSNWIVHEARAQIVARMDADDVARADRLAQQLGVLNEAEDVSLVGSLASVIDSRGAEVLPVGPWRLARKSSYAPFPHTSVMFRKSAFRNAGGYREQCIYWEDLDLWLRMSRAGRMAVIAEPLVWYRVSEAGVRSVSDAVKFEQAIDKCIRCRILFEAGESYERLLDEADPPAGGKVHPCVFPARGSAALWDSKPVRELGRLWKRAALGPNLTSLQCLVWAIWARLGPGSLRLVLRTMHSLRNRAASTIAPGAVYEWRPGRKVRELKPARQPAVHTRRLGETSAEAASEPALTLTRPVES
jgi:hypothetical protein